ncbi:hypothetical protein G5714_014855 [Onychostoma macrolepis]|uniref:Uncharacterized protein n=1 Tax=Onychostoma macrolepis TaxID=369639 RepID=A0A7J6C986_9TELE|nr:hypothetical protein G5714_014855 [Onychostoma macrolepis]
MWFVAYSGRPSLRTCVLQQPRPIGSDISLPSKHAGPPPTSLIKPMRLMAVLQVFQRHLWLNLADLKDADRKVLLNAPVTPSGDAVESIIERFAEAQKCAKAMSHVMPRCAFQQQTARSRSSSAHGSSQWRDYPRPVTVAATATAPLQQQGGKIAVIERYLSMDLSTSRLYHSTCQSAGLSPGSPVCP